MDERSELLAKNFATREKAVKLKPFDGITMSPEMGKSWQITCVTECIAILVDKCNVSFYFVIFIDPPQRWIKREMDMDVECILLRY